ncbi:MAG: Crp/Fnr family transcriptional regulator [Brevundimonas sp.]
MKNQSETAQDYRLTASLERMLASFGALGAEDLAHIRSGFDSASQIHAAGAPVTLLPERNEARLVVRGWVARGATLEDGRRQIVGLSLPGDVIVASGAVDVDMIVWTLTDAETTDASAFWNAMSAPTAQSLPLLEAWRRFQAAERLRLARQVIRLGRLNAYERTAHLLLELHERQSRLEAAGAGQLHLPLTQDVLADILGLSAVHMNRTLQQLRRSALVDYRAGKTALPDLPGLAQAAGLSAESWPSQGNRG